MSLPHPLDLLVRRIASPMAGGHGFSLASLLLVLAGVGVVVGVLLVARRYIPPLHLTVRFSRTTRDILNVAIPIGYVLFWAVVLEQGHAPGWLVVPLEGFAAYYLPHLLTNVPWYRARRNIKIKNPRRMYRTVRWWDLVDYVLRILGLAWVFFRHASVAYPLTFAGLYIAICLLDEVGRYVLGILFPSSNLYRPLRWIGTLPLAVALTGAGAMGVYAGLIVSPGLPPSLWLEVGAAAAAYLLFNPPIELAANITARRENLPDERITGSYVQAAHATASAPQTDDQGERRRAEPAPAAATDAMLRGWGLTPREHRVALWLRRFPTLWLFLGAGIGYHYLLLYSSLSDILNSSLALLVFGLLPLLAGLLQVVGRQLLDTPRYVLLFFVYVILVSTGADALFTIGRIGTDIGRVHGDTFSLFGDSQFYSIAGHALIQQFLVLATVGQVVYLFFIIAAVLFEDQTQFLEGDTEGWSEFGRRSAELDQSKEALSAYQWALRANPRDTDTWISLGYLHLSLKQYGEALASAKRALELDPLNHFAWYLRGWVCLALDDYLEARIAMENAATLQPRRANYWAALGDVLGLLEAYQSAYDAYEWAHHLAPKDADHMLNMAAILTDHLGDPSAAVVLMRRVVKKYPAWVHGWYRLGLALRMLGRVDEARAAFERAIKIKLTAQSHPEQWNSRAYALSALGLHSEAIEAIEQAIQLAPEEPNYPDSKGELYMAMGEEHYEEALAAFDQALRLDPGFVNSQRKEVIILRALGRDEEAERIELEVLREVL